MVLRRVGVWSAARMSCALYATIGLIAGVIFALVSMLGLLGAAPGDSDMPAFFGAIFGVGAIVILPIMYGVIGIISGAIGAAIYNLVAGIAGGLELELTP